jgi:hypothetical protein
MMLTGRLRSPEDSSKVFRFIESAMAPGALLLLTAMAAECLHTSSAFSTSLNAAASNSISIHASQQQPAVSS